MDIRVDILKKNRYPYMVFFIQGDNTSIREQNRSCKRIDCLH